MNKLVNLVNNAVDFVSDNREPLLNLALVALNVGLCVRSYKLGKAGTKLSFGNKLITNQFFYQMGRN
jgi:hypothetical protein